MEQREPVREDVLAGPVPRVGEAVEVRGDRAPRQDRALGLPGRPARVDDQRRVLVAGGALGQLAAAGVDVDGEPARGVGEVVGRADDDVRLRVGQDVLELPAAELRVDRDERHAGGDRGHAATQVSSVDSAHTATRSAPLELRGDCGGGLAQLAVGEAAVADGDGGLAAELEDALQHARQASASARAAGSAACRPAAASPRDPGGRPSGGCRAAAGGSGTTARSVSANRSWRSKRSASSGTDALVVVDARGRRRPTAVLAERALADEDRAEEAQEAVDDVGEDRQRLQLVGDLGADPLDLRRAARPSGSISTTSSAMSLSRTRRGDVVLEHEDHVLAVRHEHEVVRVEAVQQRPQVGVEVAAQPRLGASAPSARSAPPRASARRGRRAAARPSSRAARRGASRGDRALAPQRGEHLRVRRARLGGGLVVLAAVADGGALAQDREAATRRARGRRATRSATQSLIAGVPSMYAADSPRTKPMLTTDSAVLT